jgi:hypothetical protein
VPTDRPPGGRAAAGGPAATATAPVADPKKQPDLTVNKVVAGAGAAATSAVLGSFWGAAGTVLGAALGSVVSTVATTIYQRSLDRTRDTVKARIRLPGGRTVDVTGKVEVPATPVAPGGEIGQARVVVTPAESAGQPTTVLSAVSAVAPRRPRRRWMVLTGLAVAAFLIGLLAVTGVELVKGSTLTRGETGTSVGRVVDPRPVAPDPAESTDPQEPVETATATPEPTDEPEEPPATDEPERDAKPGADTDPDPKQRNPGEGDPDPSSPTPMSTSTPGSAAADRRGGTRRWASEGNAVGIRVPGARRDAGTGSRVAALGVSRPVAFGTPVTSSGC